jgi:hypothetical protein
MRSEDSLNATLVLKLAWNEVNKITRFNNELEKENIISGIMAFLTYTNIVISKELEV